MKTMRLLLSLLVGLAAAEHHIEIDVPANRARAGWRAAGRVNGTLPITLTIALKQQNLAMLEASLTAVSDPRSPLYGQHLSRDEVQELVAPSALTTSVVRAWLAARGLEPIHATSDFWQVKTTIAGAEALLQTEYHYHRHEDGAVAVRCLEGYAVPESVAQHIDFVSPTVRMPPRNLLIRSEPQGMGEVTPKNLRALYSVNATGQAKNNRMGIASFLRQYYSPKDLEKIWKDYDLPASTVTDVEVGGGSEKHGHGIEAQLDVQYITATGAGIPLQVWSTEGQQPGSPANEPFLKWLLQVSQTADNAIPYVFSASYGEDEKSVSLDYAKRMNTEFQKGGARGISFLFAAGDSGAGGNCTAHRGRLTPNYPTGSPYVTAVGGSTGGDPGQNPTGEVPWDGGGGGFSDYWAQPDWQKAAVATYLQTAPKKEMPPASAFNQNGRGYPDIAAQSVDFVIVNDGSEMAGVSGTSAASPSAAGVVAMLNDYRLANGKPPLGFLNPWLYQVLAKDPGAFNDITTGGNEGCAGLFAKIPGYRAIKGWDASTGVGTLDYQRLLKHL